VAVHYAWCLAEFVSSAALSGLHGFDSRGFWFCVSIALGGSEIAVVALSRFLQVMMLLPGIAFVLVVAFLATAVALNVRLVGCPFCFRLGSFVLSFLWTFIGTWLAFGCVNLHLLQPVVIVLPFGDISFGFPIRSILSITTFLFQL
jgi:hypothetical protein